MDTAKIGEAFVFNALEFKVELSIFQAKIVKVKNLLSQKLYQFYWLHQDYCF